MTAMSYLKKLSGLAGLVALGAATVSCGDLVRQGRAPVYLVIDTLQGVSGGAAAGTPSGTLQSDVLTIVTSPAPCSTSAPCPTVFSDNGRVVFHVDVKDITSVTTPTSNNQVTINRYRVAYKRSDGRNTPGVDVPYGFDGAVTGTVPVSGTLLMSFELVRHTSKMESPLVQLITSPSVISTIADVTFYGRDQVGNEVTVTGSILVDFGNFGDH